MTIKQRYSAAVSALALFVGLAETRADPMPTASEIFALRTECGKLGEAWEKKHPFYRTEALGSQLPKPFTTVKINRCVVVHSSTPDLIERMEALSDYHTRAHGDAQCGIDIADGKVRA